ncbi:cobalamin trafficking protein CblD [Parasteatoda tepidariorum]
MLQLSGKIASLQRQQLACRISRSIYSSKSVRLTSESNYRNSESEGLKKGYGEKEIYLLPDIRTPLPSNMGIPPISMFSRDTNQEFPKPAGENCEILTKQLPVERYQNICSQAAITAGAEILFGSGKTEYAGYDCPELLKRDFLDLFPHRDLRYDENLTVITICQKTENDMSVWSEASEVESVKREQFFVMAANMVVDHLTSFYYWADFIHPSSGTVATDKPRFNQLNNSSVPLTNATMYQTDLRYAHLGFTIDDMGCCRIISHHKWGTHIFVGAIFTNAKLESKEVQVLLNKERLLQEKLY